MLKDVLFSKHAWGMVVREYEIEGRDTSWFELTDADFELMQLTVGKNYLGHLHLQDCCIYPSRLKFHFFCFLNEDFKYFHGFKCFSFSHFFSFNLCVLKNRYHCNCGDYEYIYASRCAIAVRGHRKVAGGGFVRDVGARSCGFDALGSLLLQLAP
jgi:hypothetical protein